MFLVPGTLFLMECLDARRWKDLYDRTSFQPQLFRQKCSDMKQMPSDLHIQSDCAREKNDKSMPEVRLYHFIVY